VIVDLAIVAVASIAALLVLHSITLAIGHRIGRYNVVDVAWGLGFIVVAAVAALLGHGDPFRRGLMLALVTIWAGRLSWFIFRKTAGKGEDPRYADMLRGAGVAQVALKVFALQAAMTWFISLPLQLSAVSGPTPRPLLVVTLAGVLVWLTGLLFEAIGDHQLHVFKSDPAHKGIVMDRGLWAWTRHPNYFGDACVWWGLWLLTITGWWSLTTVLSPALMTYFLVYATGARLTEKYMRGRSGFSEYQQRTSFFIPRSPRSARS
jgi:steroid 5-alpha reductase family enzyme